MPEASRSSTEAQLHEAVLNTRIARHHPECVCGKYRDATHEPFCTPAEWRYNNMVDRLIDKVLAEPRQNTQAPVSSS